MTFFEVRNLTKLFPIYRGIFRRTSGYVQALTRVNLKIGRGQILGICGESGCGKSTLGRCSAGIIQPTSGFVFLDGQDCTNLHHSEKKKFAQSVQMVFQDPLSSLNPRKTILQSFLEPLMYGAPSLDQKRALERIYESISWVGLDAQILERYPHQFSGGQQQRICLARALSFHPKLIICDEILSSLDLSIQAQMMELLLQLQRQTQISLMFISHDLTVVRGLCENVAIMYLGEVIEYGVCEEVFMNPKHPYTRTLIDSMPKGRKEDDIGLQLLQDEPPSALQIPSGCPFHPRCVRAMESCSYTVAPYQTSKDGHHSWRCIWE